MSDLKTKPHDGNVEKFLHSVEHDRRREDSLAVRGPSFASVG